MRWVWPTRLNFRAHSVRFPRVCTCSAWKSKISVQALDYLSTLNER